MKEQSFDLLMQMVYNSRPKRKMCETVVFVIVGSYGRENRELLTIERSPIK